MEFSPLKFIRACGFGMHNYSLTFSELGQGIQLVLWLVITQTLESPMFYF